MIIGQLLRIVVSVAIDTTKHGIIARSGVAIHALIPLFPVFPAVNGEMHTVVVEVCRRPCRFGMADPAVGWELSGGMAGVSSLVIVICMTAITGIGGIVVISVMAGRAVIGNARMRPVKGIVIIVNVE